MDRKNRGDSIMTKIVTWIKNNVGVDGLLHLLVCKIIVDAVEIFAPLWAGVTVAVVAALAKEFIWDMLFKKGTYDKKDMLCDAVGILLGLI